MSEIGIERLLVGPYQMNCYLVENRQNRKVIIIDAGADGQKIIQAVGSRKPVAVLATHGHYDHIGGVDQVCSHFGIPLYIHGEDMGKLTDAKMNGSEYFASPMTIHTQGTAISDGQVLRLAGIDVTVLHTPGHSRGSCCFLLPDGEGIFCGDTLFNGGYGRTDLADGDFYALKQSLRRLIGLKPKMIAYPGHEDSTFAGHDEDVLL